MVNKTKLKSLSGKISLKLAVEQVEELKQKRLNGATTMALAKEYGICQTSVYRYLDGVKKTYLTRKSQSCKQIELQNLFLYGAKFLRSEFVLGK